MPYELEAVAFTLPATPFAQRTPFGKLPAIEDGEADRIPAVVAAARSRAAAVLVLLERALTGRDYLLGGEFSAADVMMGYTVLSAKWHGLLTDRHPNLTRYLARLETRPALQKALS